jgi:hypothetical protein
VSAKALMRPILAIVVAAALFSPALARADFGIKSFDVQIAADAPEPGDLADLAPSAGAFHRAGGHPYAVVTHIEWNNHPDESPEWFGVPVPDGDVRDAEVELPAGLIGNPTAVPTCTTAQLAGQLDSLGEGLIPECPTDSQVGVARVRVGGGVSAAPEYVVVSIFNIAAPSGLPARFGFNFLKTLVFFDATTGPEDDYRISVASRGTAQALRVYGADIAFWGNPADPAHDVERCNRFPNFYDEPMLSASFAPCLDQNFKVESPRPAGMAPAPFLTLPTSCPPAGQGEEWVLRTDSWQEPGLFETASAFSHLSPFAPEESAPGAPQGTTDCDKVPFNPDLAVQPTARSASSASGLEVELAVPTDGLLNPDGIAQSHLKKAVVTLPEGMTVNPSQADGLGACSPAQYAQEQVQNAAGQGCPSTAKIGTVTVRTPLLEDPLEGSVYIAQPYDNPFDSLLALYIVLRNRERGLIVKLPGKVTLDQASGQITATFDDLPQLPFENFAFKFREGPRAPLVTPSACGEYTTVGRFSPWSDPEKAVTVESSFQVETGLAGGPCPTGGLPPFEPGLIAGSVNNAAGAYSPFYVRLFRSDEEQEISHFSIKLPPGVLANLSQVSVCPDAAIEAAKTRTGAAELATPSCPASSQVGGTLVGVGVGSVQTYVPGKLYFAGPYRGSQLSVVAVTSAKVGPFDLGTVVVREAVKIDPETAEVFVDATGSDPIPHIIQGVATHLRDIRVYVDRPEFTLNPTSCEPTSTASTVLGSGLDFVSEADDNPVTVSTRYQAADCASLPFAPKVKLFLSGNTKRGGNPALRAVVTGTSGNANIARAETILPHSQFLEQGHIRTVCTRVQFAAGEGNGRECPAGSVYGRARAVTPLLKEPLEGPVILRSNGGERKLPDLVAVLRGSYLDVHLVGFIDSVYDKNRRGEVIPRIRTRFQRVPDAPVSRFVLEMQGGRKGLLANSTNLCKGRHKAELKLTAHNGKILRVKPGLKTRCPKKGARKGRR